MKWETYERGYVTLFKLTLLLDGFKELKSEEFVETMYTNNRNGTTWCWARKDMDRIEKKLIEDLKSVKTAKIFLNKLVSGMNLMLDVYEKMISLDLTKMSNEEMLKVYKESNEEIAYSYAFANTQIDAFDQSPSEYFKKIIRGFFPKDMSQEEFAKIFAILTHPIYISFIKQEEIDVLKIVKKIKDNNLSIEDVDGDIKTLEEKYFWTFISWEQVKVRKFDDFKKIVKEQLNNVKDVNTLLKEEQNMGTEVQKKKDDIIKQYNVDKKINDYLELSDQFVRAHDLRKEAQMKTLYSHYLLLWEICKRTGEKESDLENLTFEELNEILKGKPLDKELVKKRRFSTTVTIIEKRRKLYEGKESEEIVKKELKENFEAGDEVKGSPASPGIVTGTVKICRDINSTKEKIKEGDILITGMTLPDYVIYMKKAAAIVTDEGGFTCHAAITARELKKPCVIGTRIATRVFKDGDLVEVDANKGIVRKIK
ncbi:MAG: PEP-utilizing enzyme [archaeon]